MPWWRRRKTHFRRLFYDYDQIPPESLQVLQRYYESRWAPVWVHRQGNRL